MDIKAKTPIASELQAQFASQPLKSGKAAASEKDRVAEAAKQFEGLLAQQMTKSMWSTVPKNELNGSFEEGFYRDMLGEAMATQLTNGQGLGIKDVVAKEMGSKRATK